MEKEDERILVVNQRVLFAHNEYFQGFRPAEENNYELAIVESGKFARRGDVETDFSLKQPIGYCLVVNPALGKVFVYRRAPSTNSRGDGRLQGKWSCGIGGHIEMPDQSQGNPITKSMSRELQEEVTIHGKVQGINVLGYLNDDSNDVGRVHFGILYTAVTDASLVEPKAPEIKEGRLRTIAELEDLCRNPRIKVEGWSKIALDPIKKFLLNK